MRPAEEVVPLDRTDPSDHGNDVLHPGLTCRGPDLLDLAITRDRDLEAAPHLPWKDRQRSNQVIAALSRAEPAERDRANRVGVTLMHPAPRNPHGVVEHPHLGRRQLHTVRVLLRQPLAEHQPPSGGQRRSHQPLSESRKPLEPPREVEAVSVDHGRHTDRAGGQQRQ